MSSIQLPTYLLPLAALRKGVSGLWFLGAYCLGQPSADAQSATAVPPPHCSLGIDFVEIAGVTSKFAKYETRVSDFEIFMQETGYDWKLKPPFPQTGDHPVVNVNFADTAAFCEWLTKRDRKTGAIATNMLYRLPTNAEWDVAAGASPTVARKNPSDMTSKRSEEIFPWGTTWPPPKGAGNFNSQQIDGTDDGFAYTAPVGSFDPSANGLHDLAGNVWEWATDAKAVDENMATLRGGSWQYFRKECLLSSYRYAVPKSLRKPSIGFRLVLEDLATTKTLLAAEASKGQKMRDMLAAAPTAESSEVERMKQQMSRKTDHSEDEKRAAMTRLLHVGNDRAAFVNSLGMDFQTLPDTAILLCEHEVRVQDIASWMTATGKTPIKPPFAETKDHPAVNLSWIEAKAFCAWLTSQEHAQKIIEPEASYRLPTDSEWSTASLLRETGENPATKNLKNKLDFPWGFDWPPPPNSGNLNSDSLAGYKDSFPNTAPVRSFKPNSLHIFDLAGNVAEWCEDEWPDTRQERVIRGSSWRTGSTQELLSSARRHMKETAAEPDVGFRIVLVNQHP